MGEASHRKNCPTAFRHNGDLIMGSPLYKIDVMYRWLESALMMPRDASLSDSYTWNRCCFSRLNSLRQATPHSCEWRGGLMPDKFQPHFLWTPRTFEPRMNKCVWIPILLAMNCYCVWMACKHPWMTKFSLIEKSTTVLSPFRRLPTQVHPACTFHVDFPNQSENCNFHRYLV